MIEEIHRVVKKWRSTMLIIAGNVKRPSEGCDVPLRALYGLTTNKLFLDQNNNVFLVDLKNY